MVHVKLKSLGSGSLRTIQFKGTIADLKKKLKAGYRYGGFISKIDKDQKNQPYPVGSIVAFWGDLYEVVAESLIPEQLKVKNPYGTLITLWWRNGIGCYLLSYPDDKRHG